MSEIAVRKPLLTHGIEFLMYLTVAVVPLVYYNNPIATEYFFSKAFFFNLLAYGAITLFFLRAALTRELTLHWGHTFLPLALFAAVSLASLVGATNPWKGWETVARVGTCLPFLFLVYQMADSRAHVRRLLVVIAITNIAVTAFGFLQLYEVFPLPKDQYGTPDPSTTIGLTNFVMEYLTPYQFVMPLMIFATHRKFTRLLYVTATLCQYYYFAVSDNRAAMVGWGAGALVAAVLFVVAWVQGKLRVPARVMAGLAALALVTAIAFFASPVGERFVERARTILFVRGQDDAITFRLQTWKQAMLIFRDHPVRGVGLSNLEVEFPKYQSAFLEAMTLTKNTRVVRAHNEYIQVLVDLGLIGGAVFLFFLWRLGKLCVLAVGRSRAAGDVATVMGLVSGLAAFLVVAAFAFPFEVPGSALSIFVVVGLLEVFTRKVLADDGAKHTFSPMTAVPLALTAAMLVAAFWGFGSRWMYRVMHAEVNFKESRVMKDLGKLDEAKLLLDEAIRLYPQNEAYYYDRSIFYIRSGDVRAALADLSVTARLVPNYAMGHKQMGLLAAQAGDFTRAARELEQAFAIYKNSGAEYVPLLVNAYIGANEPANALKLAEAYRESTTPEVLTAVGQAYFTAKRYADAAAQFEKALAIKSPYVEATTFLGMSYIELGQWEKALTAFDQAAKTPSLSRTQKAAVAAGQVKALAALKRIGEAKAILRAALAVDPGSREFFLQETAVTAVPDLAALLK
jgi:tetratricopeptide (TPR) repeat protein/O-antigen ligase